MQTVVVILAGGRSQRMGQDKALLLYEGASFLQHAQNLAGFLGADKVVVLGRSDNTNGIADSTPYQGPAVSLVEWINRQENYPFRLITLPVDMPFLEAENLKHLMLVESGAYFHDQFLPFTAIVQKSIDSAPVRLKNLLEKLGVTSVSLPKKWHNHLKNINTPDDLAYLSSKLIPNRNT